MKPQAVYWGALPINERDADRAIVGPTVRPLADMEAIKVGALGVTTRPVNFKPPDFEFNTSKKTVKGKDTWFAKPKLKTKADEGDSTCWYLAPGLHKTTIPFPNPKALPPFLDMSKAMSQRDHDAELEHSNDHKHAYKISLKEAQKVLTQHIIGQNFGPKATEAEAKTLVLDTIKAKLTHPQLGNDKTKWGDRYTGLSAKTNIRDASHWHDFTVGKLTPTKTKLIVEVTKGTTKINVVKSSTLIKY